MADQIGNDAWSKQGMGDTLQTSQATDCRSSADFLQNEKYYPVSGYMTEIYLSRYIWLEARCD